MALINAATSSDTVVELDDGEDLKTSVEPLSQLAKQFTPYATKHKSIRSFISKATAKMRSKQGHSFPRRAKETQCEAVSAESNVAQKGLYSSFSFTTSSTNESASDVSSTVSVEHLPVDAAVLGHWGETLTNLEDPGGHHKIEGGILIEGQRLREFLKDSQHMNNMKYAGPDVGGSQKTLHAASNGDGGETKMDFDWKWNIHSESGLAAAADIVARSDALKSNTSGGDLEMETHSVQPRGVDVNGIYSRLLGPEWRTLINTPKPNSQPQQLKIPRSNQTSPHLHFAPLHPLHTGTSEPCDLFELERLMSKHRKITRDIRKRNPSQLHASSALSQMPNTQQSNGHQSTMNHSKTQQPNTHIPINPDTRPYPNSHRRSRSHTPSTTLSSHKKHQQSQQHTRRWTEPENDELSMKLVVRWEEVEEERPAEELGD